MDELRKEAEALGIDVDGRWGEARLRQEIEKAREEKPAGDQENENDGTEQDPGDDQDGDDGAREPSGDQREPDDEGDDAGADADDAVRGGNEVDASDPGDGSADGTLDGLPRDPPALDEQAREEAIAAARDAMTGPINAAFSAATAFFASDGEDGPIGFDVSWFAGEATIADFLPALVGVAVPFVRTWPEAPPEALYGHTAAEVPALEHDRPWSALETKQQLAWKVFRDVLVTADAAIAEAKRLAEEDDRAPRAAFASTDGNTLETFEDPFAPSEIGREARP